MVWIDFPESTDLSQLAWQKYLKILQQNVVADSRRWVGYSIGNKVFPSAKFAAKKQPERIYISSKLRFNISLKQNHRISTRR